MKILLLTILTLVVIAVLIIIYIKYRLDNTPDHRNLESTIETKVNKSSPRHNNSRCNYNF